MRMVLINMICGGAIGWVCEIYKVALGPFCLILAAVVIIILNTGIRDD